ncbi:MAG: hypothetical protein GXY34_11505 [Syntrophomonadaceae bacterium]|nr:hypothetical protein [Syntrophomonadaceae bacterium]
MNAEVFWNVIGEYNQSTLWIQIIIIVCLLIGIILSYRTKYSYLAKLTLGITNFYIGIVFFAIFGTQPIQRFFALPLFLLAGALFIYEAYKNKNDKLTKPGVMQIILFVMYLLYPFVSIGLGNEFPKMVTHVMPCPIISLSIATYAGYSKKNKVLLTVLTIWGLTGVKSIIFSAYEDIILLICGIYGVYLLIKEVRSYQFKGL